MADHLHLTPGRWASRASIPRLGLIHHPDQGSQFISLAFGQACGNAGNAASMGS